MCGGEEEGATAKSLEGAEEEDQTSRGASTPCPWGWWEVPLAEKKLQGDPRVPQWVCGWDSVDCLCSQECRGHEARQDAQSLWPLRVLSLEF